MPDLASWRRLSALLLLLLATQAAQAGLLDGRDSGPGFLPADEAFVLDALALDAGLIEARWLIAPGYYLYRHRLDVTPTDPADTPLRWQAPAGEPYEDEHFGEVDIFREELSLPLHVETGADTVELEFRYQGCADAGLCYPPQTRRLRIALPAAK